VLREELLSTFLGVDLDDINNKFCELLALAGERAGWEFVTLWQWRRNFTTRPSMCAVV
jgi:hypothetical protein